MTLPKRDNRLRWLLIFCGLLVWLWLNPEDNTLWPVVVLAGVCALLLVSFWVLGRLGGKTLTFHGIVLLFTTAGAIVGLGTSIITALLMVLKNARHAHFFPDFPTTQILAVLERAPLWAVTGGLIGIGLSLLIIAQLPILTASTTSQQEDNS